MRRHAAALVALAAAACSRDMDLPSKNRVALSPQFATVAPREQLGFAVTGGAGGYRLEFAPGGRLSGDDATVDASTGVYRAGRDGSAQDLVQVIDAAGSIAEARVTVTAHLAAVPSEAYLSPGATLTPAVSGGRLPYAYTLVRGAGSTATLVGATYTAGAEGDVVDRIAIGDGTGDPEAATTVTIHVGPRVRLYPPSVSVAPREALPFVALGGEPPYTFAVQSASGGTVSPTGAYVAGATGGVVDRVVVTDGNGRTASATVTVGGALALALGGGEVRPGATSPLLATGGKAPYAFGFAPRGNRSLGTVVEQTGDYVPGPNVGAHDRVAVRDAVGATAFLDPPAVGPLQIHAGPGAARCIPADLNGDGRGDVIVVTEDAGYHFVAARSLSLPAGGVAVEREIYLPRDRVHDQVLVADFNGSGRDQLVFFGAGGLWSFVPDAGGSLVFGPSLPASAFPASAPSRSFPAALLRGTTENRIVTGVRCNGTGLWRVTWPIGASSPNAPVCDTIAVADAPFAMTAGDLNGDGRPDLAWVEAYASNSSTGPLKVAVGLAGGGFGPTLSYPFPVAGEAYVDPWWWGIPETSLLATPLGVYIVLVPSPNPAHVALLRAGTGGANPAWAAGFPLALGPYEPIHGIAARDAAGTRMAAWNIFGQIALFDVGPTGPTAPASFAATPGLCATFADVNGDGLADLVSGDTGASASDVLFADGGARYGERPWFARSGAYAPAGDVDGDGLGDVLVASGERSVRVLFGGAGQLSYGPETALAHPVVALVVGDLGAARPSALVLEQDGGLWSMALGADGAVTAPASLGAVSLDFSHPVRMDVHDFGGTAAGGDVLVVTENGDRTSGGRYSGTVRYRNAGGGTGYASTDLLWQERWCEVLASGTTEVVALCMAQDGTQHLLRSVLAPGVFAAPWTPVAVPSLAGTGTNGTLAAAGTLPTGEALFVSSPSAASGTARVYAVTVAAGGLATISQLAGASGPVTGAMVAPLDGSGGWDLVVAAGGEVRTYLAGSPGTYAPAAITAAPGVPAAVLPLRTGGTNDALFATPDAFVPLVGDGAGGLR